MGRFLRRERTGGNLSRVGRLRGLCVEREGKEAGQYAFGGHLPRCFFSSRGLRGVGRAEAMYSGVPRGLAGERSHPRGPARRGRAEAMNFGGQRGLADVFQEARAEQHGEGRAALARLGWSFSVGCVG